jgi:tetratricopeptide (TPR) repeat protein
VESEIGRGYGPMSLKSELASMRARYVVETRDWSRMKGQSTFDNLDELFALGLSSVALGDQARATTALEHLRKAGAAPGNAAADGAVIATIMADELAGVQLFARGDRVAALAVLARAADAEALRPRPIARPYPIKPAAELYGEFLLASGDARGAIAQFKASLSRTPRRAASLFGLAAASAGAGARAESADAAREFLRVWHLADPGRPEVADAKRWLQAGER